MSYHIYTTDGIVLKRTVFGEADVLLYILTEKLGLILASARSARLQSSKLAPSLQEYSLISVSCIKGKNGWKITNVSEKENFFFNSPKFIHLLIAKIVSLLLKMIQGEHPHPEIFQIILGGFDFLKSLSKNDIAFFEIIIVLRILYELGYVVSSESTEDFLKEPTVWMSSLFIKVSKRKETLVGIINKALAESHL